MNVKMSRMSRLAGVLLIGLVIFPTVAGRAQSRGVTRYVSAGGIDTADCTSFPCATIAYAISQALAGDTIQLAAGTYTEAGIVVDKNLMIKGQTAINTFVQAATDPSLATDRVFWIDPVTVTLRDLTIQNGNHDQGGGIYSGGTLNLNGCTIRGNHANTGGGIFNDGGAMTLDGSLVTENEAVEGGGLATNWGTVDLNHSQVVDNTGIHGGGIHNMFGLVNLVDSDVSDNWSESFGGGIFDMDGYLQLQYSTVAGNTSATGEGGGIFVEYGWVTLIESTIHSNSADAGFGGGIYILSNTLTLTNTTLSGNSSGRDGGGIYIWGGTTKISHSTITRNTADSDGNGDGAGGGIAQEDSQVHYHNTIVLGNDDLTGSEYDDCFAGGGLISRGYNLVGYLTGCAPEGPGDRTSTAPDLELDPFLSHNGGPTLSHALLPGSQAIETGTCYDMGGAPVLLDQRGEPRPVDYDRDLADKCDIGAFELQADETYARSGWQVGTIYPFGATMVHMKLNSGDPGTVNVTKHNQPPGGGTPGPGEMPAVWEIHADNGPFDLDLTICFTDHELGSLTELLLALYRWNASSWVFQGGTVDPVNNCLTLHNLSQFSYWTLASAQPAGSPNPPTAVTLVSFTATPGDRAIQLAWETATEIDTLGFHLYRRAFDGDYVRLNENLIPGQSPGSPAGAVYAWPDGSPDLKAGVTYYYKLEAVDVQGQATAYGPVEVQLPYRPYRILLPAIQTSP